MSLPEEHPVEWTTEKVGRFWDFESHFPERYFTFFSGRRLVSHAKPFLKPDALILDYGAGAGHLIASLLQNGQGRIAAVDFSPESIARIESRFGQTQGFLGASLPETILAGPLCGAFDLIFLIETIEHLDDAALHQTFANLKRLLKPGGVAIITTPDGENLEQSLVCCPDCGAVFHRWQHIRSWSETELRNTLEREGFNILRTEVRDFSTHPAIKFLKGVRNFLLRKPSRSGEASKLVATVTRY